MITAAAAHQLLLRPISYRVIAAAADRLLLVPISYVGCVLLQLSPGVAPQTHPVVVDSRPTQYPHEDQPAVHLVPTLHVCQLSDVVGGQGELAQHRHDEVVAGSQFCSGPLWLPDQAVGAATDEQCCHCQQQQG
eukprot:GHUV01025241.1.p2 GENE.GHUV01025241.1~~GHUV01025241.1.p2  ORF type:complete len:134 (-),score=28.31 GHUV01025241.1:406-807(-)